MVSADHMEGLISGVRISTVVPAKVTGENKVYNLTDMDLALKLHYIKAVYFFNSDAVKGLTVYDLKQPMFDCLEIYYTASGRIRRTSTEAAAEGGGGGRPVVRCNDGGVRIVEANCDEKTVEEWLEMEDRSRELELLAYDLVLGPDLGFSPLVYVQFTWFKCGGLSIGLSWAHVLGDTFSASSFMNSWSQFLSAAPHHLPRKPLKIPNKSPSITASNPGNSLTMKRVDPVGPNHWLITNSHKLKTHTFTIPTARLDEILVSNKISHFDLISAMIWKLVSKIRGGKSKTVTVCTDSVRKRIHELPSNEMVISSVEAGIIEDVREQALLIAEKKVEENGVIEETVKEFAEDYIVYGANLTFLNLEGSNVYDMKIKGLKPVFVNSGINGIGEEGLVVVIPGLESQKTVTVMLPENEIRLFKIELKKEWGLA